MLQVISVIIAMVMVFVTGASAHATELTPKVAPADDLTALFLDGEVKRQLGGS